MRQIYTSLDFGTNTVKIVVGEIFKEKFHVLVAYESKCSGIKKGLIVNAQATMECVRELVTNAEEALSVKINKVIVSIPLYNVEFIKGEGYTTISPNREDQTFNGDDIVRSMQASAYNRVSNDKELVSIMPIEFIIDDTEKVSDPKGKVGHKLSVNSALGVTPKKNVLSVVKVLGAVGLEVVDITFNPIADFYAFDGTSNTNGAIINIGHEKTEVSIMHKGVLINTSVIPLGGKNVSLDIAYKFDLSLRDSNYLKENFALAHLQNASTTDSEIVVNTQGEEIKINQYELSELVNERIVEILELSKKEINHLTKKQISYIIITGGLTDITDFQLAFENVYGKIPLTRLNIMGVRHNRFSPCVGMIKYYHSKLKFRNKTTSMIRKEDEEELINTRKRKNNNLLGPIIDYFFDN